MIIPTETVPSELIRWMEVPRQPNVYALGNFARQVTFASQQARAINLVWALFKTNRLAAGQRIAVIGAGLGGMTATVAALVKGCHVDLYEQSSQPCPLQRGNDIRFIHPNILRWPEEGSETAQTEFPFLNWTAANVRGVIKQIDLQWKLYVTNNRLRPFFNYKVNRLYVSQSKSGPQRPWLTANRVVDGNTSEDETSNSMFYGYLEFSYDCVIIAVGFGEERSVTGIPFLSYWENDSLHQEIGRGRRSILVSGCGDGGLIDALRLRLRNFDHATFVRRFLSIAQSPSLINELQKVDHDLRRQATAPDISLRLKLRYDAIEVPEDIERYFRQGKRSDTTVTLNSPSPGPLSFRASLLNRYAAYLAMRFADLHYLSGQIVTQRTETGEYQVTLERDDIGLRENRAFDLVIVRHGPDSAIRHLIPESAMTELNEWWMMNEDITTKPHWRVEDSPKETQFFPEFGFETAPPPEETLDLALATFDSAYREFTREPDVQSVAIGDHDGKAGFIVTLRPGVAIPQSRFYAGVLVQYVSPSPVASIQSTLGSKRSGLKGRTRLLPIGVGIYNYDAQVRFARNLKGPEQPSPTGSNELPPSRQGNYPAGTGTLGCFAIDENGETYLLSTSHVLTLDNKGQVGDRIFIEGQSPTSGDTAVAKLTNYTQQESDETLTMDLAAARLEPDVRPDYSPLAPQWRIVRAGRAGLGDIVAKVGRTSGLTTGNVSSISTSLNIMMSNSEPVLYKDCIIINPDGKSDFSMPGDSGAVIVNKDDTAVGILIARSEAIGEKPRITIACPLEPALLYLGLKLLPSKQRSYVQTAKTNTRQSKRSTKLD